LSFVLPFKRIDHRRALALGIKEGHQTLVA
jgi:hypothetical protein